MRGVLSIGVVTVDGRTRTGASSALLTSLNEGLEPTKVLLTEEGTLRIESDTLQDAIPD